MNFNDRLRLAHQNFLRYSQDAKIILLHPAGRIRSVLLATLLKDAEVPTFYYALSVDDINLSNLLSSLVHRLSNQHPTFGRHLNLLPAAVHDRPAKHLNLVLRTVVQELSELSDALFYFVLDEYDRADVADDIQHFIERLVHRLPARCKIVLNSRTLPRLPWVALVAGGQAAILCDEQLVQRDFHQNQNPAGARMRVQGFGPGYVYLDDEQVERWEGQIPRLLVFFILDRPVVTRRQLFDVFWPKASTEQAVNIFHVTKSRLHKILECELLLYDERYYLINPTVSFHFDVYDFVDAVMEGRHGSPADPFALWQRVARLYQGPFLQGRRESWVRERRVLFRAAYVEALENIAAIWDERGRQELALRTLHQAVDLDYSCQDIHAKIMRLYADLGRRGEAVSHYRRVERRVRGSSRPLKAELQQLYSDIIA